MEHPGAAGVDGGGGSAGGFGAGLLSASTPSAELTRLLSDDADEYTWAAAVVGSNNAAGYQLASGSPVMAVGGFNGTDPSPTLAEFVQDVEQGRIHYFIEGRIFVGPPGRLSDSSEATAIAEWVAGRYPSQNIDGTVIFDLTQVPLISQSAHGSGQR